MPVRRTNPQAGRAQRTRLIATARKNLARLLRGRTRASTGPSRARRQYRRPTRPATANPQAGRAVKRQGRGVLRGRTPRTRR